MWPRVQQLRRIALAQQFQIESLSQGGIVVDSTSVYFVGDSAGLALLKLSPKSGTPAVAIARARSANRIWSWSLLRRAGAGTFHVKMAIRMTVAVAGALLCCLSAPPGCSGGDSPTGPMTEGGTGNTGSQNCNAGSGATPVSGSGVAGPSGEAGASGSGGTG